MKKLIILLSFIPVLAFAIPGETIVVLRGTIPGFKPANNTYYVTEGMVFITSSLTGGDLYNVTFDGSGDSSGRNLVLAMTGYGITCGNGNNINVTLKGFQTQKTVTAIFQGEKKDPFVTYNGTAGSCLWYNLKAQGFVSSKSTMLYNGTWEGPKTFHNVVIGWEFSDFVYTNDSSGGPMKIFGNSLYVGVLKEGVITGKTRQDGDKGFYYIPSGNLRVNDIYCVDQSGYLGRHWQLEISGQLEEQTSYIVNCVASGKNLYGLTDIRVDKGQYVTGPINLTGGNVEIYNNTAVNNTDANKGYVTNLAVIGDMDGYKVTFRNNAAANCFNNPDGSAGGGCLIKNNANGNTFIDSGNNWTTKPGIPAPEGYFNANYSIVKGGYLWKHHIGAATFEDYESLVCPPPVHDTVKIHDTLYLPAPVPAIYTTVFTTQTMPTVNGNDGGPIELGLKFRVSAAGFARGIRFYKVPGNTGTHIGELYSSTGARLGAVTFTNESASGWQTVQFSTPIPLESGKTYVAAYFSPSGAYVQTQGRFTTAIQNPPLTGLASGIDGLNGLYLMTGVPAFPTKGFNNSDYGVDIIYSNK